MSKPQQQPKRWSPILTSTLGPRARAKAGSRIDNILCDPKGVPNGKGRRTKLATSAARNLKAALIEAMEHASVWASPGPLPNRRKGVGRPPDNAVFIFIDDIMRACAGVGLKTGLRYVDGSESLPVRIFIKLSPILWPGSAKAPRRLFERWQRFRGDLVRL
jgi:hypothetical protein